MKNNQTNNTTPPTKTKSNRSLRNFTMRYYFCNPSNLDKVTCKKLNVKAYNISHALDTYDPINVNLYGKNFLNWTATRVR